MTGPYHIEVWLGDSHRRGNGEPDLVLSFAEMYYADGKGEARTTSTAGGFSYPTPSEPALRVDRFYQRGASATLDGTTKLGAFYVAALLEAGEEALVVVVGREPSTGRDRVEANSIGVRRDAASRCFMSLGSRYGRDRHFVGL